MNRMPQFLTLILLLHTGTSFGLSADDDESGSIASGGQGLEWVQPGEYTFGECDGFGRDRVPTLYKNVKYDNKRSCYKAYIEDDRCPLIAQRMQRAGLSSGCNSWLHSEVNKCRKFLETAGEECSKLAR